MKTIFDIISDIKQLKLENDQSKLQEYLLEIDGPYLPSSIMLEKAKAIQLYEGNSYSLNDAKKIIEMIIAIDPDYIPAYIEMGYFLDAVMDDSTNAIAFFDRGILKAKQLLKELRAGRDEAMGTDRGSGSNLEK